MQQRPEYKFINVELRQNAIERAAMRATLANTKATCKGVAVAVGEGGDGEVIMTKGALARRRLVLANIAYLKDDFSTRKVKSDVETVHS